MYLRGISALTALTSVVLLSALITAPPAPAVEEDAPVSPAALSWSACAYASGAQCASIDVPRDWANPTSSGTYRLSVARVSASKPSKRIGILMFNPGGPGSGAVSNLSWVMSLLPARVKKRFDIVAVDPRGVGGSQPWIRSCRAPQPTPPATGEIDWLAWSRTFMKANRRANKTCFEANKAYADTVGTWQIVHDLDAVRAALSEKRITFWGMSYGSTVGRAYAQQFPDRVRALLLDGVISPVSGIEAWAEEHTYDDELAIDIMLRRLGSTYADAYDRVSAELDTRTVTAPNGTVITRWTFGRALVAWSSFHTTWGSAGSLILAVRDALFAESVSARSAAASRAASALSGTRPTGQSSTLSPQWTYVNCSDFPDRPTARTLAALAEKGARTGGAGVGMAVLREGAQCAGLPEFGRPLEPLTSSLTLNNPPIIVNARGDNRTPWTAALEAQRAFTGSQIVGYAGTHHILYGRRTACIDKPVTRYLLHKKLPSTQIDCPI